jgi:hypothetical protein
MSSSSKNPATEAFDRIQKRIAGPIVLVASVLAIWGNDASWALLPIVIVIAGAFVLLIIGGTRLVRALAQKQSDRR